MAGSGRVRCWAGWFDASTRSLICHIGVEVDLGRFDGFVAESERDHGAVDAGVQQVHRRGVSPGVRRDCIGVQREAAAAGGVGVLGDEKRDRVAAERSAAAGRKQRLVGVAGALFQPFARHGDRVSGQRRSAPFASLAGDLNVRAGAEVHVLAAQSGELGDTHAGLDREVRRVVAPADPAIAVGRVDERVSFLFGEVGDDRAVEALGRDGEPAADRHGVFGVAERGESDHGVDPTCLSSVRNGAQMVGRLSLVPRVVMKKLRSLTCG